MNPLYEIKIYPYGLAIFGKVPVNEFVELSNKYKGQYPLLDVGIAKAIEATFALTSEKDSALWQEEIQKELDYKYGEDEEIKWLQGSDTGISSETIFSVLSKRWGNAVKNRDLVWGNTPRDPDDFGRCYRLLKKFPAWRARLDNVVVKYPKWYKLVECWDEFTTLYEEELPTGRCPKLYKRMKEIGL